MDASQASHANLMRYSALATALADGGELDDRGDELLYLDPHPFPFFSGAMRGHARPDGAALVERALAWFGARDRDFTVFARATGEDAALEDAAESAGLTLAVERYPAMGCTRRLEVAAVEGLEIRAVTDEAGARAYWELCGAAYPAIGFPEDAFDRFPASILLHEASAAFIGELGGEPVACAMTTVLDGVGLIGWVGTTAPARGRGAGAALTVAATNAAFDRGAWLASLQASPMGEAIYRRLGYRELFNYRLWMAA
jgi:GNAT superfamily N-acetyltransferase